MLMKMVSGTNTKCKNCNSMKKLSLLSSAALAALLFVGCSSDSTDDATPAGEVKTYTELGAGLPSTRTTLDGTSVVWSASDEISVWSDVTTTPVTFSLASGAGTQNATFTVPQGAGVKGTASSIYKAVYPANSNGNIVLPQNQNWNDYANFSNNVNPMVAVGTDLSNMQFKNVCGVIVVRVSADATGTILNGITLSNASLKPLAGTGSLTFSGTSDPTITWQTAYTSVTLQCGEQISTTAQDYYIVVPAGSYPDLTLTLSYKTGSNPTQTYTKTRNTSVTVQAGMITTVGANFALTTTVYKVGDLYPNADSAEGVVYAVSDGGTSGYVVSLYDCTVGGEEYASGLLRSFYKYNWGPTTISSIVGGLGNADGQLNQNAVVNAGVIADYPAFQACLNLGNGWYLPSSTEMSALMDAYSNIESVFTTNGEAMTADAYWCSNVTGPLKSIYYYSLENGAIVTVSPTKQSTVNNAVRAILQF